MGKRSVVLSESYFGEERVGRILLRIAPPVMFAQLIQALYNIVDSYFIGQYSGAGLTALSVIFPVQLIISALAIGTGVGVNTYMARMYALGETAEADRTAGTGMLLAFVSWALFALASLAFMRPYAQISAESAAAVDQAVIYGNIVCAGSLGIFLESLWTKVHQANGNMRLPMIAQVAGALTNVLLDPLLIFGLGPLPEMGVAGAAYATIAGQFVAAAIVGVKGFRKPPAPRGMGRYMRQIYALGYPSILMQSLYTVYIMVLNIILAGFSDAAVTVLGLYYKLQTFFFIPLSGLQTCIVPVLSYNYAQRAYVRCKRVMRSAVAISAAFMLVGIVCFEAFPSGLLALFSREAAVLQIGEIALRIIALSFLPAVLSLMMPVFFQAIGSARASAWLSLTRQIFCLIPLFWLLSRIGLNWCWAAFPLSELITGGVGLWLYGRQTRAWQREELAG